VTIGGIIPVKGLGNPGVVISLSAAKWKMYQALFALKYNIAAISDFLFTRTLNACQPLRGCHTGYHFS
jgi:hypothetical protein